MYHAGDIVRVLPKDVLLQNYTAWRNIIREMPDSDIHITGFVGDMCAWCGEKVRIVKVVTYASGRHSYRIQGSGWAWDDLMFERDVPLFPGDPVAMDEIDMAGWEDLI